MLKELAIKTKNASIDLAMKSEAEKNNALLLMAQAIDNHIDEILRANERDMFQAEKSGMSNELRDRLRLDVSRIQAMANGLRILVEISDPVGEVMDTFKNHDGLLITKVRVPLGLIAMIYESRPSVTVDACGLALKSGNAIILRGSSSAFESNVVIVEILKNALKMSNISPDCIGFVYSKDREAVDELLSYTGIIDLVIPRGGAGLISHVLKVSKIPVIETGVGNCHIYVDDSVDMVVATNILMNAKVQRPSVCNAVETLLVHKNIASDFLPIVLKKLKEKNVIIYGCEQSLQIYPHIKASTEKDYATEYLSLAIAVKVVDSINEAINHIKKYSTRHSEAILTNNLSNATLFTKSVDSACVYVNASTRFSDGQQFGFGAEIGISTQKLHSRGPMGLKALTSYKYVVWGEGQIRK